jgi:hypothetical protein
VHAWDGTQGVSATELHPNLGVSHGSLRHCHTAGREMVTDIQTATEIPGETWILGASPLNMNM